jgi:soluble lytic murein transglycosylase
VSAAKWILVFVAALALGGAAAWWFFEWRDHSQDAPILAAAQRYGVDPALVKAVVWRESRFNPAVRGRAGEFGLMQVTEVAAREWADAERVAGFAAESLLDPGTNTLAGTWYLGKLLRRYPRTDNPVPYALADYNAGRGRVLRWNTGAAATNSAAFLREMTFPGTRKYVEAVMHRREYYAAQFSAGAKVPAGSR